MITSYEAKPRLLSRHFLRLSALLSVALALPRLAAAQATSSLLTDASVLPRHTLGARLLTSFSRFDELLGTGGTRNLAASFDTDSLGSAQLQQLGYTQSLVRTLSGTSAFNVTAGTVVAAANSRIMTAPLILEYGLTSRLSIGVVIPLVETRTTLGAQLNRHPGAANVGPNPAILSGNYTANAALVSSFRASATALQSRLSACQATPSGAGCSTLLAQQASAAALIQSSNAFATSLEQLYGTGQNAQGLMFVPLAASDAQAAIGRRIQDFTAQYQSFGGAAPNGTVGAAGGPAANAYLNAVLTAAGYDTLQSPDRSSIGDITIGATFQLANSFDTTRAGFQYRIAVNAAGRIGTGEPARRSRLFDNSTGYGQPGMILGGAGDFSLSTRLMLSAVGSYTMNFGSVDVARVPNAVSAIFPLTTPFGASYSAGNVVTLSLVPRIRIAGLLSATGNYQLVHTAADTYTAPVLSGIPAANPAVLTAAAAGPFGNSAATAHQVGFGFAYSTLNGGDPNPGRIPFEVSFRHLETLSASGGPTPKVSEDQIQLRVFFR